MLRLLPGLAVTGCIAISLSVPSPSFGDDWPQWRGPKRDCVSQEKGLLKEWPADGPKVAWDVSNAGVGYSSLVVSKGRVISQGDLDGVEHILCWSEKDGSLLWAVQPGPVKAELDKIVEEKFNRSDKDGNGTLEEAEAIGAFGGEYLKIDAPSDGDARVLAKQRVERWLKAYDSNNDKLIADFEFPGQLMGEFERIDREDKSADGIELAAKRAAALLERLDKDEDGAISKKESDNALNRLFGRIDQKKAGADKGDEMLSQDELKTYYFSKEPGRDGAVSILELEDFFVKNHAGKDGALTKADVRRQLGGYRNGNGDGPRGTPTVDGDRIYAEGGNGDLTCLDAATGKTLWHLNLSKDLGGGRPGWGYCESPLIVGDLVIVTPGGAKGTLAALNKETGEVVWRTADVKEGAHYSSPQVAEIAGVQQIVQFGSKELFAVSMDGKQLLWTYSGANNGTANISTPLIFGDHVLASSGYGTGSGVVKVSTVTSESQKADEVYFQKKLANHHGGLVRVGDYVYAFGEGLMCMNFLTGDIVWKARSVSKGSLCYADGMLYCLGEGHEVALVEATPEEYREKGRFKIGSHGRPAWAHPVIANGRLFLRNMEQLTAYDIKAE